MKGKFITFEGCEGVGKSTQIRLLQAYMDERGIEYYMTREPGGSSISEQIRAVILDGKNAEMTDECEALLYSASRVQLLSEVIKPRLDAGELVFCDRYVDSSLAYQGYARGLGVEFVERINDYALREFTPDLTVFLDLDPSKAFMRKGGADKTDRLEQSGMSFHEKVYKGYKELSKKYANRYLVIDASGSKMQTHHKIISALKEKGVF